MEFESRTMVVTGATRGLGLALVREFSAHGWHVVGLGRSKAPKDYPAAARFARVDASEPAQCREFWAKLVRSGDIKDVEGLALINNAGFYVSGGLLEISPEQFEQSIRGNYLAAVFMTRTLVDEVQRARIVNIISTSAQQARSTNSAYGSAKAGMAQFFRSLQQEFSPTRYRITNIYPKTIRTHGEGPEVDAIEPSDLSRFIYELVVAKTSFYLAEVTVLPDDDGDS